MAFDQVEPIGREGELLGLLCYLTAIAGQVVKPRGGDWTIEDFYPAMRPEKRAQAPEELEATIRGYFGMARACAERGRSNGVNRKPGGERAR